MTDTYNVTADELKQFIERYEHLEAEKKDITDQQKEVMAEAKGRGYCVKTIREVILLEAEKKDIADQQKEVMAEARARGYCVKTIREVIRLRKLAADERAEREAVLQLYLDALEGASG